MGLGVVMLPGGSMASNWAKLGEAELDRAIVQSTIDSALVSPRLRAHGALPVDEQGWSRTLIAMTRDSYVPPHLHPCLNEANGKGERLVCVRGRCAVMLFDATSTSDFVGSASLPGDALKARTEFVVVHLTSEGDDVCVVRELPALRAVSHSRAANVVKAIEIGPGVAHSLVALSEVAILCEFKGAAEFAANHKVLLPNFPSEGEPGVRETLFAWRQELKRQHAVL